MGSPARRVAAVLLSVGAVSLAAPVTMAARAAAAPPPAAERAPGVQVPLLAGPPGEHSYVPPLVPPGEVGAQSSTFVVNYDVNFDKPANAPAKAAFQYAVDIWSQLIVSPVPIQINADYVTLPTGVLGSSGPDFVERDACATMITDHPNTWYPEALANAVCGTDLNGASGANSEEATSEINKNFAQWYFGLDGHPGGGQYDFVSVVLHELGHALGFIGSMDVANNGTGSWGDGVSPTHPFIFDRFATNGSSEALVDPPGPFPNDSTALGDQLLGLGSGVFFHGTATDAASGSPARLYAPSSWQGGSSFSHLDESTYGVGDPNSLMTPSLSGGEAIHSPGPLVLAMFVDMGWTLPDPPGAPTSVVATPGSNAARVTFSPPASDGGSAITQYTVTALPDGATGTGPASPVYVAGLANGTAYTFTVTATNAFGPGPPGGPSSAVTPELQGFHPLTPKRILDTRTGVLGANARSTPLGPQENASVQVTGFVGSAPLGADAVVMNVTAVNPTKAGWLTIWPSGAVPTASNLNFAAGQTVPNLVTVELGPSGTVRLGNTIGSGSAGSTNVIFDIVGWYDSAAGGGGGDPYQALAPTRILDTRFGTGPQCPLCDSRASALGPQETYAVPVTGVGGVPSSGVSAVAINVTAVTPTKAGWLTIWPSGAMPTASNLNFVAGQTVPNLVVVAVGAGGTVKLGNTVGGAAAGFTHVIFDVVGWYGPGASGGGLNAITPARILDTRFGVAGANARVGALAPQEQATIQVAGFGGVPASGVSAVVLNVTATGSTKAGWLTIWPGGTIPTASNLNFAAGKTVPNLVVVGLDPGTGTVKVGNTSGSPNAGFTHVIFDVVGWFASA